jgi:hypothetical protein
MDKMADSQEVHATPATSVAPFSSDAGHDRRIAGSSGISPTGTNRRHPVANVFHKPAPVPEALPRKAVLQMRAQFKVTEITHTVRGVTVLTLAPSFDGSIPKANRLVAGNAPVGSISIEVDPKWADENVAHGSAFYLSNTASGPVV